MRLGIIAGTVCALAVAGCGGTGMFQPEKPGDGVAAAASEDQRRPQARPAGTTAAPKPPSTARTAEQFDTTSTEERQAAAAAPKEPAGEKALGETIASLGDVTKPGFWLETPLVSTSQKGRVEFNGKSAQVELLPIDGPKTAGSRISLPAMRLIEAPLTDLPTVKVFAGG